MATSRQKIPLPHMLPEDKDSAYAVLWPLVDPLLKRERPPTKGKVRVAYFRRKCQRPRTTSARTSGVAQSKWPSMTEPLLTSRLLKYVSQVAYARPAFCAVPRVGWEILLPLNNSIGPIALRTTLLKMTLPPTRPLGEALVLSAMVIGTMALGAVILWAATHWLWLVVHQGLH